MPSVADVFQKVTSAPVIVKENDNIKAIHQKMLQNNPVFRSVYVVNEMNQLAGKITLQEILKVIAVRKGITGSKSFSVKTLFEYVANDLTAKTIMSPPVSVKLADSLEEALQKMISGKIEEVAVIDEAGSIIGDLNAYELLSEMKIL
ncbi:MAG: CBS domain-containing protein [Clostridia bacterium]|jgi:acetoin utilization protein AcuB|nr:CBS domain-containing protein [Clostridia bacterium]